MASEHNSNVLDRPLSKSGTDNRSAIGSVAKECAQALDEGNLLVLSREESLKAAQEMQGEMAAAKREAAKLIKAARQR